jgi:hypothetical protein
MNAFSLTSWDSYMIVGSMLSVAFAVCIFAYHEFRIFQIKDYKEKYDYVNLNEIRFFWYMIMALIVAGFFYTNTIASTQIQSMDGTRWFFVRLFITISFAVVAYFIFFSMVRVYYPRNVERRLQKLRHTPRLSPQGNLMRRLGEDEEDIHLEQSQQEEEASEIHSVDYDVWIDEKTGFKKIEKYRAYQHALECAECGYVTLRLDSEEIEKAPTQAETGLLLKHYRCTYCKHREAKEVTIARLADNR